MVSPGQVNPPDFTLAPEGPYAYDLAGPRPFFIGLGLDFLGYIVPEYDFKLNADGAHYEETNSASGALTPLWRDGVYGALRAVGGAR